MTEEGYGTGRRDADVVKIHGHAAAEAAFRARPEAVVRAYIDTTRQGRFSELMRALAAARVAYRLVPPEELERVTKSRHHEGICLLVKPRPEQSFEEWARDCPAAASVVILDGVSNPHNLGAIVRTAAHFGARAVWQVGRAPVHGALARVAEGGAESVPVFSVSSAVEPIRQLKEVGFEVCAATVQEGSETLFESSLPRRTAFVLGAEQLGLSEDALALADRSLWIPGTGAVESLNVASAAAVFLAEHARQRHAAALRRGKGGRSSGSTAG